jgi:hypothetical protein
MSRYYFNLRSGDRFEPDPEGVELSDVSQVPWEAEQGARSFVDDGRLEVPMQARRFEVTDDEGKLILVYPFSQVSKGS